VVPLPEILALFLTHRNPCNTVGAAQGAQKIKVASAAERARKLKQQWIFDTQGLLTFK